MNEQEISVIDLLTKAHLEYVALPIQHPSDIEEWVSHLHALQRIVMSRQAVRENPKLFYNEMDK